MKASDCSVGMLVKSKNNPFGITYKVVKTKKATCWVETVSEDIDKTYEGSEITISRKEDKPILYKNVRYSILKA